MKLRTFIIPIHCKKTESPAEWKVPIEVEGEKDKTGITYWWLTSKDP